MPELPEVETSRRGIAPYLVGETIQCAVVRHPRLRWPVAEQIVQLRDEQVFSLERRAKYLLMELRQGWIIVHLGMSGRLRILSEATPPAKHDHIDLILSNGKILRYTDPRRFGAWLWETDLAQSRVLRHLGPEPLSEAFTADWLIEKSKTKRIPIKSWLMDNKLVVGVGNIYASESLFMAAILPTRPAHSLTLEESGRLVECIKRVLQRSIDQGGTTLRDFLQSDGKPGYFAQQLNVYGRAAQPCMICATPIATAKLGQRSTFWCPNCQY